MSFDINRFRITPDLAYKLLKLIIIHPIQKIRFFEEPSSTIKNSVRRNTEKRVVEPLIQRQKDSPGYRMCMLIVTHSCNLNCTYCYESHKSQKQMAPALAKAIILEELALVQTSEKFEKLEIHFIGGEPFMNFRLIREIVEWLSALKHSVPVITSCSTNGTLIDDSNKGWLRDHKDILHVILSYDGDFEMQRQNRHTTKSQIDVQFFIDTWPDYSCHMTISKETLPKLAHGVLKLQRAGGTLDAAVAQGADWTHEDAITYREQLSILADAYLIDSSLKPINLLAAGLFGIAEHQQHQRKYCGTGTSMKTYDVDGRAYPCHMFSPIVCGTERALKIEQSGITENCPITDQSCEGCNILRWCPTCYGINYHFRGDMSCRDHRLCTMIRTQAIAACEFQLAYYSKHVDKLTKADMAQLKGALNSYHILTQKADET